MSTSGVKYVACLRQLRPYVARIDLIRPGIGPRWWSFAGPGARRRLGRLRSALSATASLAPSREQNWWSLAYWSCDDLVFGARLLSGVHLRQGRVARSPGHANHPRGFGRVYSNTDEQRLTIIDITGRTVVFVMERV